MGLAVSSSREWVSRRSLWARFGPEAARVFVAISVLLLGIVASDAGTASSALLRRRRHQTS